MSLFVFFVVFDFLKVEEHIFKHTLTVMFVYEVSKFGFEGVDLKVLSCVLIRGSDSKWMEPELIDQTCLLPARETFNHTQTQNQNHKTQKPKTKKRKQLLQNHSISP